MINIRKIDRKRKYLLIVGACLLLGGVVYRVWPEINDIFADDNAIAIKKRQLVKYEKMVGSLSGLEGEITHLHDTLKKSEKGLLTGKTTALAAANIQQVVQDIAKKCQIEIKSVRVLKPKEVGGNHYLSIPVQLSLSGDIRQLKEFLYQIMISPKYLTVQDVKIIVRRRRRGRATVNLMSADITVNGFLKNLNDKT